MTNDSGEGGKNGRQGAPKWPTGSGKVSTPRFLGVLSNSC